MKNIQNPFDLHTITPYLIVTNTNRLITFLQNVFGAKLRGDINYRKDKTVQHAEIKIGDSIIMLAEPTSEYPDIESTACGMYIYVDDCDKIFDKAIEAGGKMILKPNDYPHGDRYGGVKDFAGNIWWIVTHKGKLQTVQHNTI